jgi:hypothetical protein
MDSTINGLGCATVHPAEETVSFNTATPARTSGHRRLRITYIWLAALAAACVFSLLYVNAASAHLTKLNYAGLFNNRNAGASSNYTMGGTFEFSGQDNNAANGDDIKKLVFDWPSGMTGIPTQIPAADRCNQGDPTSIPPGSVGQSPNYAACPAASKIGTIEVDVRVHIGNFLAQLVGCGDIDLTLVGSLFLLRNYPLTPVAPETIAPEVPTYIGIAIGGEPSGLCGLAGSQDMTMTAKIVVRPDDQGLRILMIDGMPRDKDTGSFGTAQIRVKAIRQTANAQTSTGKPFLRNPTRCVASTGVPEVDRWRSVIYAQTYTPNNGGNLPPGTTLVTIGGESYVKVPNVQDTIPQCGGQSQNNPPFAPTITVVNKNTQAGAPTGVLATVTNTAELNNPALPQTSHIKKMSLTMPKELRINPAIAERLQDPGNPSIKSGCTEAQFNKDNPDEDPTGAGKCPGWSQVGTIAVEVPELSDDLVGRMFLGQPQAGDMQAPTLLDPDRRSIFRLYMWAKRGGVNVKFEGRARVNQTVGDPNYGQISVEFGDPSYTNPLAPGLAQFDFTKFILDFDSGSTGVGSPSSGAIWGADADRQMMMNPQECGTYQAVSTFTPWTSPTQGDTVRTNNLTVTAGPNGSCGYRTFAQDNVANPFAVEDGVGSVSTTGLGFGVRLTTDYDQTVAPNDPASLKNATTINGVGRHPTMTFKITRPDRMDNLRQMRFVMPEGFGGSIKATSNSCSVATLNSIAAGTGGNCPSDAKVGDVSVDTGAGPLNKMLRIYGNTANGGGVFIMDRHDYEANPGLATGIDSSMAGINELTKYTAKLAIVTPAVVGPFNLGAVVNKLYMRLAASDKFQLAAETGGAGLDQSIRGIPVLYRALTIKMQGINTQGTVPTTDDRPFLILPSRCASSLQFSGTITSAGSAPAAGPETTPVSATPTGAPTTTGCTSQSFAPTVQITNFQTAPATPSGMSMQVNVPQTETGAGYGTIQQSTINRMRVQFPPGVEMNPAVAETLEACPTAAINQDLANTDADTNRCESNYPKSKLGEVYVNTPLLPNLPSQNYAVKGAMYLEQQGPTANTRLKFVLYLAMPGGQQIVRGGARIAGSTDGPTAGLGSTSETTSDLSVIDGTPLSAGQLEADFNGLPDVTYNWMRLDFQGGRAPDNHIVGMFVTPSTCQVNSARVRVNSSNIQATTVPSTYPPGPANKFFNTPGDPNLSFTTTPCPAETFAPTAQIQVTANSRTPIPTRRAAHPDVAASILRADKQKDLKTTIFHLPPGMTGAPTATSKCPTASAEAGSCPASSIIGKVEVELGSGSDTIVVDNGRIYNTEPKTADEPARLTTIATIQLGPFDLGRMSIPIVTSLRAGDMGLDANVVLPQRFEGIRTHYRRLSMILYGYADQGTVDPDDDKPFLTNPSKCQVNTFTLDAWAADNTQASPSPTDSFTTTGCPMDFPAGTLPTMDLAVTNNQSEEPTGLDITMTNGTEASYNPTVKKIKIDFPQGMTVNPAVGNDGLAGACSTALINAGGTGCPAPSERGTVEVKTPLLVGPGPGGAFLGKVYLETPGTTKETRFRLALVVSLPGQKLILRGSTLLDGSSDLTGPTGAVNTGTGVISAVFDNIVDLPFHEMKMHLNGGARGLLVNPATCGTAVMKGEISPNSGTVVDERSITTYSSYSVNGCLSTPPAPTFNASLTPARPGDIPTRSAGHPNFNLTVGNLGKSPQLSEFDLDLPPGFVADTVATPRCSQAGAQIGNCPANTVIGDVTTVMGSSVEQLSLPGKLHNVDPDTNDQPARLQAILNVVVGPFDLGKLSIPVQTTMRSDYGITTHTELPYRYEGIDVFVRQLTLTVNGWSDMGTPGNVPPATNDDVPFMINPTKCGTHTITARILRRSGPPVAPINQNITIDQCPRAFTDIGYPNGIGLKVTPATTETGVPTPLTFDVTNSINNPTLKRISMEMPVGMELNPAVGNGLTTCPSNEIDNHGGAACLNTTANVGSVTLNTPLLPVAQTGNAFLEEPIGNDKDTRYRTAIVVHLPGKDMIVRGKVTIDGSSTIPTGGTGAVGTGDGRIRTYFYGETVGSDLPDLAFSKMSVNFNGGPLGKPMFVNPRACTTAQFNATVTPHGNAGDTAMSDSYATTLDCSAPAFNPAFTGSSTPAASAGNPLLTMTATTPAKHSNIKTLDIDLPTGLVASTGNVPLCSITQSQQGNCDSASDVGDVSAWMGTSNTLTDDYRIDGNIYNVAPLPGEPARLAVGIDVVVGPYNLGKLSLPVTAELRSDWGVTTHTSMPNRYEGIAVNMRRMEIKLASSVGGKPFAINPSKCQTNTVTARMGSDAMPTPQTKTDSFSFATNNCVALGVLAAAPSIGVVPSTTQAGSPVGLRIDINSPEGNPTIKRTDFTFPQGLEINAAFAKDLDPCPTAEINDAIANTGNFCSSHSKIADVTMTTPLMSSSPQGRLYLESPGLTKDDRYRVALILDLPGRKLVVRGAIAINGTSTIASGATGTVDNGDGQMTAVFDNIPDLGFTKLRLNFVAGSKAMMVNPTSCTPHTFTGRFTPNSVATVTTVTTAYTPTGCNASFAPNFTATVSSSVPAGHPDLTLKVTNAANQQELRKLKIKLPVGLVANTTATPTRCSQNNARDALCLASQAIGDFSTSIGSTDANGMVDDRVTLTGGAIYNVVPNSNEPARMQAVMPVVVGPFDLGKLSIPVTTKLNPDMSVDADTTIPTRYEGIAVKVREMNMKLNGVVGGNNFMINPSRCATHTITGVMESVEGLTRSGSSNFTTSNCPPLAAAYNPSVSVTNTPATAGAPTNIDANITIPNNSSTTSKVKMTFPVGFEISPGAGTGLVACTTIDSDAGASCVGNSSRLADVTLTTPLLPDPQTGQLFLEPSIGRWAASRFRLALVVHLPGQNLIIRGGTLVDGSSDLANNLGQKNVGNGRVTAEFPGLPDLGFSSMQLNFNGAKKLFVNPKTAGSFNVATELTPHAGSSAVTRNASMSTSAGTSGMNGFAPQLTGSLEMPGTNDPATTGSNPDLNLQISNPDGMNELRDIKINLPVGLVARTTGVPQCALGDAQASNCNPASKVGTVTTTIGSFGETLSIGGDIMNVIPAANQPARMYANVPVVVGPFNLGNLTVDVPTKLNSDLTVTATTVLPERYEGIAVRVRQLDMTILGQPTPSTRFMVAPSKCGASTISADFVSNQSATASSSFGVNIGGCARQWVAQPTMTVSAAPAVRNAPSNLTFKLHSDGDNPTIQGMHVELPDNAEINPAFGDSVNVCAPELVDAGGSGCPTASKIGVVKIRTHLLDPAKDYFGEVYLETQGATAATRFRIAVVAHLPGADLVVRGRITVAGATDIAPGGTGSTAYAGPGKITADFDSIPDLGFTDLDVIFNTTRPMLVNPPEGGTQTLDVELTPHSGGAPAAFSPTYVTSGGVTPAAFNPTFVAQVSNPAPAAHPNLTLRVDRTNNDSESIRDFDLELPVGLVASTVAATACDEAVADAGNCTAASRVGSFTTRFGNGATASEDLQIGGDIFNVAVRRDGGGDATEPARLSAMVNVLVGPFDLGKLTIPITTALRSDAGVNTATTLPVRYEGIGVRIKQMNITLLGMIDPGTPGNTADDKPFIQNPSKCQSNAVRARITSASGSETVTKQSNFDTTGCPAGFGTTPTVNVSVTPAATSAPTSLGVEIGSDKDNPTIGKMELKLPVGMSVNAQAGNDLVTCSPDADNLPDFGCAPGAVQGTVEVHTPLLGETYYGNVYLEDPIGNDHTARYRMAIVLELPGKAIVIHGRVQIDGSSTIEPGGTGSVDQGTGQVTTVFDSIPDLSFDNFKINLKTGSRALLTNRDQCGVNTVVSTITPSSGGAAQAANINSNFTLTSGSGCDVGGQQFNPAFTASANSTVSGANTDLNLTVTANGSDQQLRNFDLHLPVGLVADTTATDHCSQADAADAACTSDSLVGTAVTRMGSGTGAGGDPLTISTGEIHNVEPNKDGEGRATEPARMAAIVPVLVGPYDLGKLTIPVTTDLRSDDYGVDAHTQIPLKYEGIIVRIQQMQMTMQGTVISHGVPKGFIKNPSRCSAGTDAITATFTSGGAAGPVTRNADYPITDCNTRSLSPAPTIATSDLKSEIEVPTGLTLDVDTDAANPSISRVKTTMPDGMTINPAVGNDLETCGPTDLAADTCPSESVIGSVEAQTPLLAGTYPGKIVLEPSGATPNDRYKLAMIINVPGTDVIVHGVTEIDGSGQGVNSGTGLVVTDFTNLPDLNFSHMKIRLDNGPRALLANSSVCGTQQFSAEFWSHADPSGTPVASPQNASNRYELSYDGQGANCPEDELPAQTRAFNPQFSGSVSTGQAAGNPDVTLKVTRADKTQQLKEFNLNLPPGLVANAVQHEHCSRVDADAGNCSDPLTIVGQVSTKIGTGSDLLSMTGNVHNVEVEPFNPLLPDDEEPARMAAIFDVQVGPYDLGKLSIPVTTKIVTGASPSDLAIKTFTTVPERFEGVPVRMREMEVKLKGVVDGKAFMINPSRCGTHTVSATMKSPSGTTKNGSFNFNTSGCPANFNPSIDTTIPTGESGIPTGFNFAVNVPGNSSSIQAVTTTLPEGFEINPGVANRGGGNNTLTGCPTADIDSGNTAGCTASQIGTVTMNTPLLPTPRAGKVFLEQDTAPGTPATRYKLAIVIDVPGPDLVVHGNAIVNGTNQGANSGTGQISASFTNLPDLQFSRLEVDFEAGPHAMLTSPKVCSGYTSSAKLTPWSIAAGQNANDATVTRTDDVTVNGDCTHGFSPSFSASLDDSTQAASSDFTMTVNGGAKDARMKKMTIGLPVGLVANTTAAPQCLWSVAKNGGCLAASKVGEVNTSVGAGSDPLSLPGEIFNVVPQSNEPARMAATVHVLVGPYDLGKLVIPVATKIRSGNDPVAERRYGIDAIADLPTRFEGVAIQLRTVEMTMYGQVGANRFMVNPSKCGSSSVRAELEGDGGQTASVSDTITIDSCRNAFVSEPAISAAVNPTETAVPTNFSIGITSSAANQTISSMETKMPLGMTINPAFGNGFGTTMSTCPSSAIDAADFSGCTDAQIGTVSLVTPLLAGTQTGKVYLEEPGNSAATRFRIAVVVDVPGQKLVVRGAVTVDGATDLVDGLGSTDANATGRITATFDDIPDLGFTSMNVAFNTGERSLLTNPETCGPQNVEAKITPTGGSTDAEPWGTFVLSYDGSGAPCPAPASEAFEPNFNADFSTLRAAGNPDVTLTVGRQDKTQQIKDVDIELPPGLVANTVETPKCTIADSEQADCAAETQVGTVTTNVGTGDETLPMTGGIYNVETLNADEPARMAAAIGVNVGPYNLGKLSVPIEAEIVGTTASTLRILTHTTLPKRYEGIPVRVRQMQIALAGKVDGKPFMINPSKCDTHTITAHMTSTLGATANPADSFTTGECENAAYSPNLNADLLPDSRAGKPVGLKLGFGFTGSSSSTKSIRTVLPAGMGINPAIGRLAEGGAEMVCDPADVEQLASNPSACPANSRVGEVTLDTPLLPTQRTGAVYLESPGVGKDNRYRVGVYVSLPGASLVVHGRVMVNGSSDIVDGLGSVNVGTGQVIAEFDNLPDLQFSNMEITFNTTGGGKHALMTNPETCGSHSVKAQLVSWARPSATATQASDNVTVTNCDGPEDPIGLAASTSSMVVGEHADVNLSLTRPDGNRSILATRFQLPKGLVGSADAAPTCLDDATHANLGNCPADTQVGEVELEIGSSEDTYEMTGEIYNVVAPEDRPAKLVFASHVVVGPYDLGRVIVPVDVNIDPNEYFLFAETANMPQRFEGIAVRISAMRVKLFGYANEGTPQEKPFMSNPRSCSTLQITGQAKFATGSQAWVNLNPANVGPFTGCENLNLNLNAIAVENYNNASFEGNPLDRVPEAPTNLRVTVTQGSSPNQAGMKDMAMTLPGFRLSAAAANGSDVCTDAQLDANTTKSPTDPDNCPAASRVGRVWLDSALLPKNVDDPAIPGDQAPDHSLWGWVYLTSPGQVAGDRYKLAIQLTGKTAVTIRGTANVDEDPNSPTYGEMVTEFKGLPDIPFDAMEVDLTGVDAGAGVKPLLLNPENPSTINPLTVVGAGASMSAWSSPNTIVTKNSTTPVTVLPGTAKGFAPNAVEDISTHQSGANPNVKFTYTRADGELDIRNIKMSLPAGFLGSAAAVPLCPVATANAGNCSAASEIGTVDVKVGQFGQILPMSGHVYMTEGVNGDIAGMSIKVPAVAGAYDLGDYISQGRVTIREADHGIDVDFADVPRMFKGVPTHMSEMEVSLPGSINGKPLMFNSSSCQPQNIVSTMTAWDVAATVKTQQIPYQATGCPVRTFQPQMSFAAQGGGPGVSPAWTIKMGSNFGDSTLAGTTVVLPSVVTVNVAGLAQACTADQAAARACLPEAKIGTVSINTPLLTYPVVGTVYMAKSITGAALPDILLEIPEPINMQIRGASSFVNVNQIQSKFENLPDLIFSDMTMSIAGGQKGLLMLRDNGVCGAASSQFISHSGQVVNAASPVTGIEGFCKEMERICTNPTVAVSTKGVKKKGNKKASLKLSLTTSDNCKAIRSVSVTFPKGSKFNKKLYTYNKKKKATKKYPSNVTGRAGFKSLNATGFKLSRNKLTFKAPFPDDQRSLAISTKNSALVLPYKTFCGHIKKGKKYAKTLKKCLAKKVSFTFDVTNADGSVYRYVHTVAVGSKSFK